MAFNFKWGHLASQKFAGLVFCVTVCFLAGLFMESEPTTSAVVMGICALYTAFVGGRAWSDGQAIKAGMTPNTVDVNPAKPAATTTVKKALTAPKESEREVD